MKNLLDLKLVVALTVVIQLTLHASMGSAANNKFKAKIAVLKDGTRTPMKNSSTYPMKYSNPLRNSNIAATSKAKGHITWAKDFGPKENYNRLVTIINWGENQVVVSENEIHLYEVWLF